MVATNFTESATEKREKEKHFIQVYIRRHTHRHTYMYIQTNTKSIQYFQEHDFFAVQREFLLFLQKKK